MRNLCLSFAWLLSLLAGSVSAQDGDPQARCLSCHTASSDTAVHAIFNTLHGGIAGGGNAACTSCHGDSQAHQRAPSRNTPDVSYGPQWTSALQTRNAACLGCHEKGEVSHWAGSAHQREELGCDNCHSAHRQRDLAPGGSDAQDQCLACHTEVRAELHLPSRHPIAEGKTACIDCHNPHGGLGDADLRQVTLNDNCFSCHQEKRGPFLWEHPPAAEDCSLCHRPHGSVHGSLLTARGPAQC
ncbi:MAG: DmsE family decaheme c-type cytochrome, partial [Halioglobus sp.]|nr:DmsE family decaheme c-type cytochrome [Halioglobus sp.]